MESKNEIETNKLDISASLVENPSLSATNSLVWSPVWEANLIVEGKNNIGNLYQGAIDSAFDRDGLIARKITHIVHCESYFKPKFVNEFNYLECSIDDDGGKDLFFVLKQAIPFIKKGREKGNVLVHCAAGISRSSSIMIGYLLCELRKDINVSNVEECRAFLRTKRKIAEPQIGYIRCLTEFQKSEYNLESQIIRDSIGRTPCPEIKLHKKLKQKKILGIF